MAHINSTLIYLTAPFRCPFKLHFPLSIKKKWKNKRDSTQFFISSFPPSIVAAFKQANQGQPLISFLSSNLAKFTFPSGNFWNLSLSPWSNCWENFTHILMWPFWFLKNFPSCHVCYQISGWLKYVYKNNFPIKAII